jgi:hypothetical protein
VLHGCVRRQSTSDSDTGSDSDLETIGLARVSNTAHRAATGTALRRHSAHTSPSQRQAQQDLQSSTAWVTGAKSAAPSPQLGRGPRPVGTESLSSQYVPAVVELLAAEANQGAGNAGAYSWHAAAAEFGAAESSLGLTEQRLSGAPLGVRAVASDPLYADGPLHNDNLVRGSVAIVQRGECTFLEKARRVQVGVD